MFSELPNLYVTSWWLDELRRKEAQRHMQINKSFADTLKSMADKEGLPPCEIILDPSWTPNYSI